MTGYVLKTKEFDHTVVHIWPASLPQIYRELKSMEEDRLIRRTVETQNGGRDRLLCHITPAGRRALHDWLRSVQDPPKHREAFLVQLFFAAKLSDEEIIALLDYQLQVHQERLAALQPHQSEASALTLEPREQALRGFTLAFARRMEQTYIDWLTDCIAIVNGGLP